MTQPPLRHGALDSDDARLNDDRTQPLFLAHQTYRRRRWMDAARLLPFLAMILFFLPTLWSPYLREGGTSYATVYLFTIWAVLILVAGVLAHFLAAPITAPASETDQPDQETESDGL